MQIFGYKVKVLKIFDLYIHHIHPQKDRISSEMGKFVLWTSFNYSSI